MMAPLKDWQMNEELQAARAEIERLTRLLDAFHDGVSQETVPASYHLYEVTKLEAKVEQLRAALRPFAKMYAAPGGDLDKAIANARAALEPKP